MKKNVNTGGALVLVGTYRKECKPWIQKNGLYNYPITTADGRLPFAAESISRVVLYNHNAKILDFDASFKKIIDLKELRTLGYPISQHPHAARYALFALKVLGGVMPTRSTPAKRAEKPFTYDQPVFVQLGNFAQTDKDKAILSHWLQTRGTVAAKPYEKRVKKLLSKELFDLLNGDNLQVRDGIGQQVLFPELFQVPFLPSRNPRFTFIDLFAGIGGFHLALEQLGGKCIFASEWDKDAQETYSRNFGIMPFGDITRIKEDCIPAHDVLCAGFPCQPFSKAGAQKGFEDETKGTLFFDIERILRQHHTKFLILENVRNLVGHDKGKTWSTIHAHLQEIGYRLTPKPLIVSPHYFGIPQIRERVVVVGVYDPEHSQTPLDITIRPEVTKEQCSVYDILEDEMDVASDYYLTDREVHEIEVWDEFYKNIKESVIGFPIWVEWFKKAPPDDMPEWKKVFVRKNNALYINNRTFIDRWLATNNGLEDFTPTMRKMEWQCGTTVRTAWDALMQKRPSGLRIKRPDCAPALVAIVQVPIIGRDRRYLTVREAARLQSFPDAFLPNSDRRQAYKQFGNAVNVEVIKQCARRLFQSEGGII